MIGALLLRFVAYGLSFNTNASLSILLVKNLASLMSSSHPRCSGKTAKARAPAPDANAAHPRLAVSQAGNASTFTRRYVYEGIMRHVVGVLRSLGHPVDIFANLKLVNNPLDFCRGSTDAKQTVLKSILSSVVRPVVERRLSLDDNTVPHHATLTEDNSQLFNKP